MLEFKIEPDALSARREARGRCYVVRSNPRDLSSYRTTSTLETTRVTSVQRALNEVCNGIELAGKSDAHLGRTDTCVPPRSPSFSTIIL